MKKKRWELVHPSSIPPSIHRPPHGLRMDGVWMDNVDGWIWMEAARVASAPRVGWAERGCVAATEVIASGGTNACEFLKKVRLKVQRQTEAQRFAPRFPCRNASLLLHYKLYVYV